MRIDWTYGAVNQQPTAYNGCVWTWSGITAQPITVIPPTLFLQGNAQRNVSGTGTAQRNVFATGNAQRNIGVTGNV